MRRAIMLCCRLLPVIWLGSAYSAYSQSAADPQPLPVAIVAPFDGDYAILAEQIRIGAQAAQQQLQVPLALSFFPEACQQDQDAQTAQRIREKNIKLVIGYLCSESLQGAAAVLNQDDIAILTLGSRQPTIAELQNKQNYGIFRLQSERKHAIELLIDQLSPSWRAEPFAVLEDGTVQGRDFAASVLLALKAKGLQPALTDTYRPAQPAQNALIARLKRANIHHLLLGGEGDDAAIIARSAQAANHKLTIAGSETLLHANNTQSTTGTGTSTGTATAQPPLPAGLLISAMPQRSATAVGQSAQAAITALGRQSTGDPDFIAQNYALLAYAAVEIAQHLQQDNQEPPISLRRLLHQAQFDTAAGAISFTAEGLRRENPYRLQRFNGQDFEPAQ